MPSGPASLLAFVIMAAALLLIPLGLPGLWIMVATLLLLAVGGLASYGLALSAAVAVLVVEGAEWIILKRMGAAYGGSKRAFWGAIVGGMAGLFFGLPVPIVGPLAAAFLGTFVGALAVTWWETRSLARSVRVGWGVVLARAVAVGLKVGTGLVILLSAAVGMVLW